MSLTFHQKTHHWNLRGYKELAAGRSQVELWISLGLRGGSVEGYILPHMILGLIRLVFDDETKFGDDNPSLWNIYQHDIYCTHRHDLQTSNLVLVREDAYVFSKGHLAT